MAQTPLVRVTYLVGKRFFPRYVIIAVLAIGIFVAMLGGLFHLDNLQFALSSPTWTRPEFSLAALISVGIPLFIVTMTSQNVPGIAILNASGFNPPISPLMTWIGIATLVFAPFGCYSISLTAMTAAICSGEEADDHPGNRYKATIIAGLCWLFIGTFGATVVTLFFAFPKELTLAVAGLAVFSTIGSSFKTALEDEHQREPAIITILISASGISLFGVGAAFWGLIAGVVASLLLNWKKRLEPIVIASAG